MSTFDESYYLHDSVDGLASYGHEQILARDATLHAFGDEHPAAQRALLFFDQAMYCLASAKEAFRQLFALRWAMGHDLHDDDLERAVLAAKRRCDEAKALYDRALADWTPYIGEWRQFCHDHEVAL